MKSAFATSGAKPNAKTNTSEIVFFILLPFQSLSLRKQGTVNIFYAALSAAFLVTVCLLKNRLFGLIGPTLINGKKRANEGFCCNFLQKLVKIVNIHDYWRSARIYVYFQAQDPAFSCSGQGW